MRKLFVIGIGAGDPEHVTVQAINALNAVDVFFVLDKGRSKQDLLALRRQICERYITNDGYRFVEARDPERDRTAAAYESAVDDWHEQRAALYEKMISDELGDEDRGGFLVWGDPALYDSTLRILERITARGTLEFEYEVIPGISSVQALAARHRIMLNRIGEPIHITTGRRLAEGLPDGLDNVVVMLDGECAFSGLDGDDIDIYWGAYLGTDDELLLAGRLSEVSAEIERCRLEARERKGWIMDTYLLRRTAR
jgi:precorrin-6A synthase